MEPRTKYVGIIGHDHSGSTALCRLLASVPGLSVGGELHWLLDAPRDGGGIPMRAGWSVSRRCTVHGESCPAFSHKFTSNLDDASTLYAIVREKLGGGILISSDKYPSIFEKHLNPGEMLGIVLFKHPYRSVASDVLTNRRSFEEALHLWTTDYAQALEWAPRFCQDVLWLRYEEFATRPDQVLADLCAFIGVSSSNVPARLATDYHFIGGNAPARESDDFFLDEKWRCFMTDEMQYFIDEDRSAQHVLNALLERS